MTLPGKFAQPERIFPAETANTLTDADAGRFSGRGTLDKTRPNVTGIERALDVFEAFQASSRPLSLTELAGAANIPKSTCHAIVATLSKRGYLYALNRPRAFYPTKRMYDVTLAVLRNDPIIDRILPALERLRESLGETVLVGKMQGDSAMLLQVLDGLHAVRFSARAGDRMRLHASAIGKSLLGSMGEAGLRQWLAGRTLEQVTDRTIVDADEIFDDVVRGRKAGYFRACNENRIGVWALAAVVNVQREAVAVSIAGPQERFERNAAHYVAQLVTICGQVSRLVSS